MLLKYFTCTDVGLYSDYFYLLREIINDKMYYIGNLFLLIMVYLILKENCNASHFFDILDICLKNYLEKKVLQFLC